MPIKTYSHIPITLDDLQRLGDIARQDREGLFKRSPVTARLYRNRILCVTLAQGAALHFIDGENGVHDFDVWTIYRSHPERPFPYRRLGEADFRDPRFGQSPDKPDFIGRRVDLIGRSIEVRDSDDAVSAVRRYLRESRTASSQFLAAKAVVVIEPHSLIGEVIWPANSTDC